MHKLHMFEEYELEIPVGETMLKMHLVDTAGQKDNHLRPKMMMNDHLRPKVYLNC